MKKYLMSLMALLLFTFFAATTFKVSADVAQPATCTSSQKTLVFHYMKFNGNYDGVGIYTWAGDNSRGSDGLIGKTGTDSFGAIVNVCLGDIPADNDDKHIVQVIPTFDVNQVNGQWYNSKDSFGGNNLKVDVTELYTEDANGATPSSMDVYFIENGDSVANVDETKGNAIIVYAASDGDYKDWGIHTWDTGTGGSAPGWDKPLAFEGTSYNKDWNFPFKIASIAVASDSAATNGATADTIGFIVHKGGTKAYDSDLRLDVSDIKGSGVKTFFYIKGEDGPEASAADFLNVVKEYKYELKFIDFNVDDKSGTYAPKPDNIIVKFNLSITLRKAKEDGTYDTSMFSTSFFTLKQGDTVIPIEVSYRPNTDTDTEFLLTLKNKQVLNPLKDYTLSYDDGNPDPKQHLTATTRVLMDTSAPTIDIVGNDVIKVTQGSKFKAFPDYVANDDRDGDITKKVYVPEGRGFIDTSKLGYQTVTLAVDDFWGNHGETRFTVQVVAPEKNNNLAMIIGISVGGVLVLGVAGVVISRKFSK